MKAQLTPLKSFKKPFFSLHVEEVDFGVNISVVNYPILFEGNYVKRIYSTHVLGSPKPHTFVILFKDNVLFDTVAVDDSGRATIVVNEEGNYIARYGLAKDVFRVEKYKYAKQIQIVQRTAEDVYTKPVWENNLLYTAGQKTVTHEVGGFRVYSYVYVENFVTRPRSMNKLNIDMNIMLRQNFEPEANRRIKMSCVVDNNVVGVKIFDVALNDVTNIKASFVLPPTSSAKIYMCPMWYDGIDWRVSADVIEVLYATASIDTDIGSADMDIKFNNCSRYYNFCLEADVQTPTFYVVRRSYAPLSIPVIVEGIKPSDASLSIEIPYRLFIDYPHIDNVFIDGVQSPVQGVLVIDI
ncbi:MAG: hypothetical protein QXD57_07120 [Ignisphaera sp.]